MFWIPGENQEITRKEAWLVVHRKTSEGVMTGRLTIILCLICTYGCSPFVEYEHLSDPRVVDDGYDLFCGGLELEYREVRAGGGICQNLHGGQFVKLNVRWVP